MRQKMADYQEAAPEVSWDKIAQAVADHQQKTRQSAKTVPMWFRKVAVAAVLLIIAGVGYMTLEHDAPEVTKLRLSERRAELAPVLPSENRLDRMSSVKLQVTSDKLQVFCGNTVTAEMKSEATEGSASERETEAEPATLPSDPEEETQDNRTEQRHTNIYYTQNPVRPSNPYKSTASESRLTAKLYFSNTMGNSELLAMSSRNVIDGNFFNPGSTDNPQDKSDRETDLPDVENNDNDPGIQPYDNAYTQTITTTYRTRHHQPIRYGLSLRYRLSERWGIETGLAYTLLTSDITTTEEGLTTESEQRLSYVGIPLKAEYTIWGNRHFNVYASGGAMVEKMVKGTLKTSGKGTKESLSIRPLQFSISSGIGAEYRYNDLLSIYVEPGVGYYFDNGSSVPTFYQDKPLSFNLNVGLRFWLNGK